MHNPAPQARASHGSDEKLARELDAAFSTGVVPTPGSEQMLEALAHARMLRLMRWGLVGAGAAVLLVIVMVVLLATQRAVKPSDAEPGLEPAEPDAAELSLGEGPIWRFGGRGDLAPAPPPQSSGIPLLQSRALERVPPISFE